MIIISEHFKYRLVLEQDAEFILQLRTNIRLNKYLNHTENNIELQKKWINDYRLRESNGLEYYYIFFEDSEPRGTYRIYNINNYSFTIGSWLFDSCNEKILPIIADLEIGDIGFYSLKKDIMIFDVRKNNKKVIRYHQLKEATIYNEDDDNIYFIIKKEDWELCKKNVKQLFRI
jgi:hypothetical protein